MSVIVIGGGPAGIMAAITAAERGKQVILIEKNDKIGRKMYISGKGRCNITNDTDTKEFLKSVVSNPKFLMSAINKFSPTDTVQFFESRGLKLKTERGGRVFPQSDKSADVIDLFLKLLKANGIQLHTAETVISIAANGGRISKVITNRAAYEADAVVIATGGLSYPKTGSTGDGYAFAQRLGHSTVEPKPSLCPILLKGAYDASGKLVGSSRNALPEGLSLKNAEVKITSAVNGATLHKEFGEMLFTKEGVSGPVVLSLSSKINRTDCNTIRLVIDLKPALDTKTLDARLLRDFQSAANKQFKNSLGELLPKSMIPYIINLSCIDPDKPVNLITKGERKALLDLLKGLCFAVEGLDSIDQAIVTAGGISAKEVNPTTMASKIIENLYFAGEVLDVDALTGGYNIQIALSTGYLAGSNV